MDTTSKVNQIMMVTTQTVQAVPSSTEIMGVTTKVKLSAGGSSKNMSCIPTF